MKLDAAAYGAMLDFIAELQAVDQLGSEKDLDFLSDDMWLQDTVVVENVELRHGAWSVLLVFAHYRYPLQLIRRFIKSMSDGKKALVTAHYMRRLAAKDQRGTLAFGPDVLRFNEC